MTDIPNPDFREVTLPPLARVDAKTLQENAMKLGEAILTDDFKRTDIGDYVLGEIYDVYDEEKADELNAMLLSLIPGGTIRVGIVPIPMALVKIALAKVLDKVTPQVPLQFLVQLLRKAKLTTA